jgi:hypothetical protein
VSDLSFFDVYDRGQQTVEFELTTTTAKRRRTKRVEHGKEDKK